MTVELFRDALSKGLGRTMFALRESGGPARFGETLIAGCLENLSYSFYLDADRAPYLFRLIEEASPTERALEAILMHLPFAEKERDRAQILGLLTEYAERGDKRAWEALFERGRADDRWAWTCLSDLGPRGLEWLAKHVVPELPHDRWYTLKSWLPGDEEEDTTATQQRLRILSQEWREETKSEPQEDTWGTLPTRVFLQRLGEEVQPVSSFEFARRAPRGEGREAARRLLTESNPRALRQLTRVFKEWGYPLPVRELFRHATDPKRGWAVCEVLGTIHSPAVRHFVRVLLVMRPIPWNALGALFESFHEGDEAMILPALDEMSTYDRGYQSNTASDLIRLMREYPDAQWQPHAEWIYEHSPRSRFRVEAVQWMVERGSVPDRIREEAAYDAEPTIRARFV